VAVRSRSLSPPVGTGRAFRAHVVTPC